MDDLPGCVDGEGVRPGGTKPKPEVNKVVAYISSMVGEDEPGG